MKLRIVLAATVAAALLVPSVASAHHATGIEQEASCAAGLTVRVAYADFGAGHILHVETTYDGRTHVADRTPNGTGTLALRYGSFDGGGVVSIEAWAQNPDGSTEQDTHQASAHGYSLRCSPPHRVTPPSAFISRACGDPMVRWTLRAHTDAHRFRIDAVLYAGGAGRAHTWYVNVPAKGVKTSAYHHLLGGSKVTIRSGGKVLASKTVEPAGQYGPCPR